MTTTTRDLLKKINEALAVLPKDTSLSHAELERQYRSLESERKSLVHRLAHEREEEDRYHPHRYIIKCKTCGGAATSARLTIDREAERRGQLDRWVDDRGKRYSTQRGEYRPIIPCRLCGKGWYGKEVKGIYNPDIVCNAKCQAAKGPDCECSCGGESHGKAWGS